MLILRVPGEHTVNGDHSDAHQSTFSHSSKEVRMFTLSSGSNFIMPRTSRPVRAAGMGLYHL